MAAGGGVADDGSGTTRIRVLTLNLLSPRHADWERRRPILIDGLRTLRPDVVAFQETVWGNGYDQAADLLGPASGWLGSRAAPRTGSAPPWPAAGRSAAPARWTST